MIFEIKLNDYNRTTLDTDDIRSISLKENINGNANGSCFFPSITLTVLTNAQAYNFSSYIPSNTVCDWYENKQDANTNNLLGKYENKEYHNTPNFKYFKKVYDEINTIINCYNELYDILLEKETKENEEEG